MRVAENSAVSNVLKVFSSLHSVVPLGLMGILSVMALPMPAMAKNLLIGALIALSIPFVPVFETPLQPIRLTGFPSLLLTTGDRPAMKAEILFHISKTFPGHPNHFQAAGGRSLGAQTSQESYL